MMRAYPIRVLQKKLDSMNALLGNKEWANTRCKEHLEIRKDYRDKVFRLETAIKLLKAAVIV